MQTNPAIEHNRNVNSQKVREISPAGEEKVYGGKDAKRAQCI